MTMPVEVPLEEVSIEAAAARPPWFLGLPKSLSTLLLAVLALSWILISGWPALIIAWGLVGGLWAVAKVTCSQDWHAWDIFVAWCRTDLLALDARQWGGVRLTSLPIASERPFGMFGP